MANPRQDIANFLAEAKVDFPPSATTQQLRKLLKYVVGEGKIINISDVASNSENSAAVNLAENENSAAIIRKENVAENSSASHVAENDAANVAVHDAENVAVHDAENDVAMPSANNAAAVHDVENAVAAYSTGYQFDTNNAVSADTAVSTNIIDIAEGHNKSQRRPRLADLDEEVTALKKRLEVLRLMKQIEDFEARTPMKSQNRLDFGDIEHALPKFSGDDVSHSIRHFINDFEDIMESAGADDNFKLLALRRSLIGTARVFLSTTSALSYVALRQALMAEFDIVITRQEIYRMLSQRRWKRKEESMHRYVLSMQALAKRANVAETEVIDFIIDGIESVPNIQILLTAHTLNELKSLISRFQYKYFGANMTTTTTNMKQSISTNTKQPMATTNAKQSTVTAKPKTNATLCYNCSRYEHTKPSCPYPLRPDGACFRCWRMGHDHRSYPNPPKVLKIREDVAFVSDEADYQDVIDEFNFAHPGTKVYNYHKFSGWLSLENVWRQVSEFRNYLDEIGEIHQDGINVLGYSQGGLIARVAIQTLPTHNIRNFISLSSPQAGQFGANFLHLIFPNLAANTAYELFYSNVGQHISVANYWNDPFKQDLYFKFSNFLPIINNEVITLNSSQYRSALLRLNKLILVGGPNDGVITPWESSHFGFFNQTLNTVPLHKREIYTADTIGLQTLDKNDKLIIVIKPFVHHLTWHTNQHVIREVILPYLD